MERQAPIKIGFLHHAEATKSNTKHIDAIPKDPFGLVILTPNSSTSLPPLWIEPTMAHILSAVEGKGG